MASKIELPEDKDLASRVIDAGTREAEMGYIGGIFGSREHAPTNIGGIIVIMSIVCLILVPLLPIESSIRADLLKIFGGLVFAALGYIFGAVSAKSN